MKAKEILNRLRGISCPIFGLSWKPPPLEIGVAKQVVTFLEDRRVLYVDSEMEIPEHCVRSVMEIRKSLTEVIGKSGLSKEFEDSLRAMRASCRKFLGKVDDDVLQFGAHRGHFSSWTFNGALGALRGEFGVQLARLVAMFSLDVEDNLASILPGTDAEE